MGCGGDGLTPAEPSARPTSLYWRLTLNQRAINLDTVAPYDTFRLVATPRVISGMALDGPTEASYTSADPARVIVSPEGLVKGLRSATRIAIVARVTQGDVTHVDTALVSVTTTATPPVLARLSLDPQPSGQCQGRGAGLPIVHLLPKRQH
jgi:hypothetical protein